MSEHRIVYMDVAKLVPARRNPKRHAESDIQASLNRFGYAEPIMLDERTERLVAGHGRVEALVDLLEMGNEPPAGVKVVRNTWKVPVVRGWASKDDEEADAYLIASNHLTSVGGWESSDLAQMLDEIRGSSGLNGLGFTTNDVEQLLIQVRAHERKLPGQLDDENEEFGTICSAGDTFCLGEHLFEVANPTENIAEALEQADEVCRRFEKATGITPTRDGVKVTFKVTETLTEIETD